MTATHHMTTLVTALTRIWTEASPASANNVQRLTALFQAGARISAKLDIIGIPPVCAVAVISEDFGWDFDVIDASETSLNQGQIENLITSLREYAELVKERAADGASDADWLAMVHDSMRRGTSAAQLAGERTACGDKDALFLRDVRALMAH